MNADELKAFLAETEQVSAGGVTWEVGDPTIDGLFAIQAALREWTREGKALVPEAAQDGPGAAQGGDADEAPPEPVVIDPDVVQARTEALVQLCMDAIGSCVRLSDGSRVGPEAANGILVRTGIDVFSNPLAEACMRRCGCGVLSRRGRGEEGGSPDGDGPFSTS